MTPGGAGDAPGPRRARSRRPAAAPPSSSPAELAAKAAALRRLELDVTRRLDGLVSGSYLAYTHGPGTEPAGARAYVPGDDARRIDWCLSSRSSAIQVRTTEADRELETWVVADRSSSLDFGTALCEKREVVLGAVAAFGSLALRAGNRLGIVVAGGDELLQFPARAGRTGMLAALSVLYDTPRRDARPARGADLEAAMVRVERIQARRGQIVVVSDWLDTSGWKAPLSRLAWRHQVIAAHVTDPRELDLPPVGMLSVVDTETGQRLHVQTSSEALRRRYGAAARERAQRLRRSILECGAEHLDLSTDRDWLVDVATFVGRRRRIGSPQQPGPHPALGVADRRRLRTAPTPEGVR